MIEIDSFQQAIGRYETSDTASALTSSLARVIDLVTDPHPADGYDSLVNQHLNTLTQPKVVKIMLAEGKYPDFDDMLSQIRQLAPRQQSLVRL
jgi:hypothetical protein